MADEVADGPLPRALVPLEQRYRGALRLASEAGAERDMALAALERIAEIGSEPGPEPSSARLARILDVADRALSEAHQ